MVLDAFGHQFKSYPCSRLCLHWWLPCGVTWYAPKQLWLLKLSQTPAFFLNKKSISQDVPVDNFETQDIGPLFFILFVL